MRGDVFPGFALEDGDPGFADPGLWRRGAVVRLGMGHARAILAEPNGVIRGRLAEMAVKQELSVRAIEEIIRQGRKIAESGEERGEPGRGGRIRSAHLRDMEQKFERVLKTKVAIAEGRKKGTGKIVIDFFTLDDFDRVAGALGIDVE